MQRTGTRKSLTIDPIILEDFEQYCRLRGLVIRRKVEYLLKMFLRAEARLVSGTYLESDPEFEFMKRYLE